MNALEILRTRISSDDAEGLKAFEEIAQQLNQKESDEEKLERAISLLTTSQRNVIRKIMSKFLGLEGEISIRQLAEHDNSISLTTASVALKHLEASGCIQVRSRGCLGTYIRVKSWAIKERLVAL